jgi:hypothetical protein
MMSTAAEAILGAVHLDGGDEALVEVMDRLGLDHTLLNQAVMLIYSLFLPLSRMVCLIHVPINLRLVDTPRSGAHP